MWLVIATSQLILRRMGAAAKDLDLKMWAFPYLTWVAIASIGALLIGMLILDATRESLFLSLALAGVVAGIGVWRYRSNLSPPHNPDQVRAPEDASVPAVTQ